MRDRGRHLPDRGELLRLDQFGLSAPELFGHIGEGTGQIADFVSPPYRDRMVEISRTDYGHGFTQLRDWSYQTPGDEKGSGEAAPECQQHDAEQDLALRVDDCLYSRERLLDAEFARLAVDLAIQIGQRGKQPHLDFLARDPVALFAMPRVGQGDHTVSNGSDLALYLSHGVSQLDFVRAEFRAPAIEPVIHHLAAQAPLFSGIGVEAAQLTPNRLGLVGHRAFDVRLCAGAGPGGPQR